jgi:hypothetical protein
MSWSSLEVRWRFGATYCLRLQGRRYTKHVIGKKQRSWSGAWKHGQVLAWVAGEACLTHLDACFLLVVCLQCFQSWRWKHYVPPKLLRTSIGLHDVTAVRTSHLTLHPVVCVLIFYSLVEFVPSQIFVLFSYSDQCCWRSKERDVLAHVWRNNNETIYLKFPVILL